MHMRPTLVRVRALIRVRLATTVGDVRRGGKVGRVERIGRAAVSRRVGRLRDVLLAGRW